MADKLSIDQVSEIGAQLAEWRGAEAQIRQAYNNAYLLVKVGKAKARRAGKITDIEVARSFKEMDASLEQMRGLIKQARDTCADLEQWFNRGLDAIS